jgi:hypothetical protein
MERYCIISNDPDIEEKLLKTYKNFVTTFSSIGPNNENERCVKIAINSNARHHELILANRDLLKSKDVLSIRLVPNWKTISQNNGPYFENDNYIYTRDTIYNIKTGQSRILSYEEEQPLYIYSTIYTDDPMIIDQTFDHNFWKDYKKILKNFAENFTDIDFSEVKRHSEFTRQPLIDERIYATVVIDGTRYPVSRVSVPGLSLITEEDNPSRGRIIPAITRNDVFLNSPVEANGIERYGLVSGASWSAKYRNPITSQYEYIFVLFETPISTERELEEELDEEMEEELDEELEEELEQEIDYENESRAQLQEIDAGFDEDYPVQYVPRLGAYDKPVIEDITEEKEIIDFINLSDDEKYLPLTYILPHSEQWEIALKVIQSDFFNTINIEKITDYNLRTIELLIKYARNKGYKKGTFLLEYIDERMANWFPTSSSISE